jgi:hypothetical protein
LPVVQDARRIDEDIAVVIHDLAALQILDLHIITAPRLVPSGAGDLVLCFDIAMQTVLAGEVVEVGEYLSRASVNSRPVEFGLERPCVVVRWDVACASAEGSAFACSANRVVILLPSHACFDSRGC